MECLECFDSWILKISGFVFVRLHLILYLQFILYLQLWRNMPTYLEKLLELVVLILYFLFVKLTQMKKIPLLFLFRKKFFERFISSLVLRIRKWSYYFTKVYYEFTIEFLKKLEGPLFKRRYVCFLAFKQVVNKNYNLFLTLGDYI